MKVGMIGLGRMGEGMSRRLIAAGHEVHGYRNNYKKAEEQFKEINHSYKILLNKFKNDK